MSIVSGEAMVFPARLDLGRLGLLLHTLKYHLYSALEGVGFDIACRRPEAEALYHVHLQDL